MSFPTQQARAQQRKQILAIAPDLGDLPLADSDAISQCRQRLQATDQLLNDAFNAHQAVRPLVHGRAAMVDIVLTQLWQHMVADSDQLALVAVGGYGRGSMHPGSDVDIMVLATDVAALDNNQDGLETFLTLLWDIGLEVGHSVRTIADCSEQARNDVTIMTNLLESTLLVGPQSLFEAMRAVTDTDQMWSAQDFFTAKLEEQQSRYQKYHDTAYKLEPNVKESPGGLRDIQTIGWVAKRHFGAEQLRDLVGHGFLTEDELDDLISGLTFLWEVRFALHVITGRREDRLLFDLQPKVAAHFGYTERENNTGVEQFMQRYYRKVMRLSRLNEMLLQHFQEAILLAGQDAQPLLINDRFHSHKGYLEARHDQVFVQEPVAMLEMFLLLQQNKQLRGVRAATIRQVRRDRDLIDKHFRNDPTAQRLFMEILRQPEGITHELRRMNRYGILARYLPPFLAIVGRMQYDLFHTYTVDEHTMFVIRNLRRLALSRFDHEYPFASKVMQSQAKKERLYVAALFHDIAKGRGGDHSELGAEDAEAFCHQHGFSVYDTQLVSWLVRNHLLMSTTSQRKDTSDPDVIHEFAMAVGNPVRLDCLYLLTLSDMRGTNPDLLTSWKERLLTHLYKATQRALRRGLTSPIKRQEVITERMNKAMPLMYERGLDSGSIEQVWHFFPEDYFLRFQADEIAWHTSILASNLDAPAPFVCVEDMPEQGGTCVLIYTEARDFLFAHSTAILDQLGLTILDARIATLHEQRALDIYVVADQDCQSLTPRRCQEVAGILQQRLAQLAPEPPDVTRQASRQVRAFHTDTQVHVDQDDHNARTIMEVITGDHPGLLSTIGAIFAGFGVRIHDAKIATIGERAEDVFFITDRENRAITNDATLNQLQQQLQHQLQTTAHEC